jgi:P-type conjugative transfer protein TrbJ
MQAIGFANQLASQQANQLLQIRGLLIAQQNAVTARMQAEADLEAQQQAAHATSRESGSTHGQPEELARTDPLTGGPAP